jgi:hypothetical protein
MPMPTTYSFGSGYDRQLKVLFNEGVIGLSHTLTIQRPKEGHSMNRNTFQKMSQEAREIIEDLGLTEFQPVLYLHKSNGEYNVNSMELIRGIEETPHLPMVERVPDCVEFLQHFS